MNETRLMRTEHIRQREIIRRRNSMRILFGFIAGFTAASIIIGARAASDDPENIPQPSTTQNVIAVQADTTSAEINSLVVTVTTDRAPDDPADYRPAQDISAAEALAKMVWGEARGCSTTEQAAAMWCVLNRVDNDLFPDDVLSVVSQPSQFHGYHPDNPVTPDLLDLAEDVLYRWGIEDACVGDVGRVLPEEYIYFWGDGYANHFTTEYGGGLTWDWRWESPYEG